MYSGKLRDVRSRWPRGLRRRSWPFGYWDRGFESRSGMDVCLCVSACVRFCVVLSCVGRAFSDGMIARPKESHLVF
jgi:hypothetical protein